ncbi:Carboxypeptidase-like domain-containing protein [Desulfonema limicola]|uniref:Carboxypeptidase-like domain-containing protein n=1 Tax=Desulfonema limicola TaxID=45656 RepID=A0A975B5X9_9BACT|nr:carboxypeptidase-like regulatory domain-containing protein [Desulfonema limicola]QTA79359.1 Carboxypeptidase-like domain-containing protein [Desulfonema limicola]
MKKILLPYFSMLVLFLISQNYTFAESYKNYIIPSANITIDGNKLDWNGIQPAFRDKVNDQSYDADFDGTDLENFYVAKDNTFFYFLMELYDGNPKSDIGTQYLFRANTIYNNSGTIGDRFLSAYTNPPNSWVGIAENVTDGIKSIVSYPASYLGIGDKFIEWQVLQSDFGSVNQKFIQTWIHSDGNNVSDYDITNIRLIYEGGTISGQLTNSDSQPIQNAIVKASGKCGEIFYESLPTDINGNFTINLDTGNYFISYEVPESGVRYWYSNGNITPVCNNASSVNVTLNNNTPNINLSLPEMQIEFWYVQHRKYEDGREFSKAAFAMKNVINNNYILDNILVSMELYDPEGNKIQPSFSGFGGSYKTASGRYDSNNGRWYFDNSHSDTSYYSINFDTSMKTGNYRLVVTDSSGNQYEAYYYFNSVQNIPVLSSKTVCAFKDGDGNLVWKWEIPSEKFSDVNTTVRTWVSAYANESFIGDIFITVPTHLGWAFAPANLLQALEQFGGETLKIGIHVRSNDNNNRNYTTEINWENANACACDVNGDQKTGLVEAIYSLQVVAGTR